MRDTYRSEFIISSWLLPFVSGTNKIINTAPETHIPANENMLSANPIVSISNGKYLVIVKEKIHKIVIQIERAISFILSGNTSLITKTGIVSKAKFAMNRTNEYDARGIQLNASTE